MQATIKVFISHQSADSIAAHRVANRLKAKHGIETYLDVIDPYIGRPGEDLAEHIQGQMSECTQLLAIVSDSTRFSQWVPWEIGMATEKDLPLATYAAGPASLPEFLRSWPVLRSDADLDFYAARSRAARRSFVLESLVGTESLARERSTREFFRGLRADLRQR